MQPPQSPHMLLSHTSSTKAPLLVVCFWRKINKYKYNQAQKSHADLFWQQWCKYVFWMCVCASFYPTCRDGRVNIFTCRHMAQRFNLLFAKWAFVCLLFFFSIYGNSGDNYSFCQFLTPKIQNNSEREKYQSNTSYYHLNSHDWNASPINSDIYCQMSSEKISPSDFCAFSPAPWYVNLVLFLS